MVSLEKLKRLITTDSMLLFSIPILTYFVTYQYNISYLGYFGIPSDFYTIDINTMTSMGAAIFCLFLTLVIFMKYAFRESVLFWRAITDKSWKFNAIELLSLLFGQYIIVLYLTFYFFSEVNVSIQLLVGIPFILFYTFCYFIKFMKSSIRIIFPLLFILFVANWVCKGMAYRAAANKSSYTIISNAKNQFVVERIGDNLICLTYDSLNVFSKTFTIIPMNDCKIMLENKYIGVLHSPRHMYLKTNIFKSISQYGFKKLL